MLRFDQRVQLPTLSEADYVHDIAYDYYGRRFALCTSSLRILIFGLPDGDSPEDVDGAAWVEIARMERAHAGPIWRLCWGHPEHGEPLASCSEDRTINVWSERPAQGMASRTGEVGGRTQPGSWVRRKDLVGEGPLVDLRFAPAPLGLKLATVTADGKVRVYECLNPMGLETDWIFEDLEQMAGRHLKTAPSQAAKTAPATAEVALSSTLPVSAALDWRPTPFGSSGDDDGAHMLAVGRSGQLSVWIRRAGNSWIETTSNSGEDHPVDRGGIKDLAWCPNLCRAYELVATCGAGACLWRFDILERADDVGGRGGAYRARNSVEGKYKLSLLKLLISPMDEVCPVWRCSWNLTGTSLALCPEGCEVSIWRADAALEWRQETDIDLSDGG